MIPRALSVMVIGGLLFAGPAAASRTAARAAPELAGGVKWLNTIGEQALTIGALRNKVVLVEFWTGG